jgi:replicative DNA helicase
MNLYHTLLKAFLNKDIYDRYNKYVDYTFIRENYPEVSKLYYSLETLHKEEREEPLRTVADLELVFATLYPKHNVSDYRPLFKQLEEENPSFEQVSEYCKGLQERAYAGKLAGVSLAVAEGTKPFSDLQEILSESPSQEEPNEEGDFIDDDLALLLEKQSDKPGLRWPLDSLNRNLGSLRQGDFGFVFARPETGKTTFLATVVPFMAGQTDRPVLWFNNEEQGDKVLLRLYQSVLGCTLLELHSDVPKRRMEYQEKTKGNVKFVRDAAITKSRVELLCRKFNPSLVIFDQIDKIHGFHKEERNDIELKSIYVWARELAKQYAPIIAICQAGASGEGKRWLTMGDVDNSKTGKQGEADWILGIGKVQDEGLESVRYLHLSKNKLLGDADADGAMRHGKWEVRIRPEVARYEDF